MSTKTSEKYWKDRSEQLLLDVLEDGEKVHRKLKSAYSKAQRDIENDIRLLLFRFQTQTGLDSKAAYELLKGEEFKQWRMDISEYLAQIEATGDEKLLLELNTLAMRSRINRLEALQGQIKANMAVLANEETKQVGGHLAKAYEKTFYQNMYSHYKENTAAFISVANKSKIRLDLEAIKKLMLENWKGSNYSKRIWKRQYEVAELISGAVARNITRGQSLDNNVKQMMDSIKKTGLDPKLKSDYEFNCKRLIMTETAYMKAKADIDTYKRMGIEEYKFLATLDNKTSDECQEHDNKIYKVEDAQPGTNYPPLHPQCRSTTVAIGKYTPKEGTRAARNEDGSVYYVDKNLDYKAWKEKYVDDVGDEPKKKEDETAPKQEEPKTEAKNEEPKKKLKYTQEEVDRATEYYVSGDGMWINTYLRDPKSWEENYGISEDELKQIEALKQGTDSEEVKEKVLYRSADARSVFDDISESDYYNLKSKIVYNAEGKAYDDVFDKYVGGVKGKEIVEKGFMSTSKNQDVALEWGDFSGSDMPIVLELDVPKGIRGRDLKDFEIKGDEQFEVLLPPNQKYKVNSIGHKNGQIYVKADLISEKPIEKSLRKGYNKQSGAVFYTRDASDDYAKDKEYLRREVHAYKQYNAIRNRNHKDVINNIYNNITKLEKQEHRDFMQGFTKNDVEIAFNHVFNDLHDLAKGLSLFDPDYHMANSWTRLIQDLKNIEYKDLVLLRHERLERDYMKLKGMPYNQAHDKTNETYNYQELIWKEG